MKSRIYASTVFHQRLGPVEHGFRYTVDLLGVELDELERLDREVRGFGYNRFRPVALHDKDYVWPGAGSVRQKITQKMAEFGQKLPPERIVLLTMPRYFGYVFNPVSFYLGYHDDALRVLVAEVNNTFGERHLYVMPIAGSQDAAGPATTYHDKEFHVSPFHDMEGRYQFRVVRTEEELEIRIEMLKNGSSVFRVALTGRGVPLTAGNLALTIFRHPLRLWMTMPRILVQAAFLRFRARLPVYRRPEPTSARTVIRRRPAL